MKILFICLAIFFYATPSCAVDGADFTRWLQGFKKEAMAGGISQAVLMGSFKGVKYNELVIKLDRNQPEFRLSLQSYLERTVSDVRVEKGKEKLSEKITILNDVANMYGVQPRFMVALWGLETDFGRVTGSFPIIEALATLSFDPRRSSFFKKELLAALHVVNDGYIPQRKLEGSWAGAMGYLQFLPSVFLKYGVDLNRDGQISIWESSGDLFATGANYLASSGWNPKWTWGREVSVPDTLSKDLPGLNNKMDLSNWQRLGVRKLNGRDLPKTILDASLIQPDLNEKRYFLIYNNFRVLMKWNHSTYYAVAVGLLSDSLKYCETTNQSK